MTSRLKDRVAIVTGASRGGGRGIALALGTEGATVYVTGRSLRGSPTRPDMPESTIDETAERVTALGGVGIAVRCDHTVDSDVASLFERVGSEQGRLDLLVNNVWGGYERYDDAGFDAPFWEQPLWRWEKMFTAGLRAHFTASRLAAPFMISKGHGLIVNTIAWDRGKYLGSVPYTVAKTGIASLAYGMALELRPHGVSALSLAPGWMRTEEIFLRFATDEQHWHEVPALASTESTGYIGRAVAALVLDPDVIRHTGQILMVGDLADEYGFTDVDGRLVPPFQIPDEYLKD